MKNVFVWWLAAVICGASTSFAGSSPSVINNTQSLALSSTDTLKDDVPITVNNPSNGVLEIEGVQTSSGLFLKSFPTTIAPNSSGNIMAIYVARPSGGGDTDFVRLLTQTGEQVIVVKHGRPEVATLDNNTLSWSLGDTTPKSVYLKIVNGAARPMALRTRQKSAKADMQDMGGGVYKITITPVATTDAIRFPVFIDLQPSLPDVNLIIGCSIGIKEGNG